MMRILGRLVLQRACCRGRGWGRRGIRRRIACRYVGLGRYFLNEILDARGLGALVSAVAKSIHHSILSENPKDIPIRSECAYLSMVGSRRDASFNASIEPPGRGLRMVWRREGAMLSSG